MAFGSNSNDLELTVKLLTEQAQRAVEEFKDSLLDGMRDAGKGVDGLDKVINKVGANLKGLGEESTRVGKKTTQAFTEMQRSIITANQAVGLIRESIGFLRTGLDIINEAGKLDGLEKAFGRLQATVGDTADNALAKLRKATEGYLSDVELMKSANQAILLGLPAEGFDQMAAAAIKLGRAMGIDAAQSIESLTLGIGRQSKLILDNLGIIIDSESAYKKFAAANNIAVESMSDAAKQAAFTAEAYEKIRQAADRVGAPTNTAAISVQQLTTQLQNAIDATLKAINSNEQLARWLGNLARLFESLSPLVGGLFANALRSVNAIATLTNTILEGLVDTIIETTRGFAVLGELMSQIGRGEAPSVSKAVGVVAQQLVKVTKESKSGAVSIGNLTDALESTGKASKTAADGIDKLSRDLTERIEKAFGFKSILEIKIEKEVAAAFQAFNTNTPALVSALDKIQKEILSGMLDPEEARKAANAMMKAIEKNLKPVKVPVTLGGDDIAAEIKGQTDISGEIFGQLTGFTGDPMTALIQKATQAIMTGLSLALEAAVDGFTRDEAPRIGAQIGDALGGPIGSFMGQAIGEFIAQGGDSAGTRERKAIDAYFADLFDAERLSIIVNGEIQRLNDLTFEGMTNFGGSVRFGGENFFGVFNTMSQDAQAGITAVGVAFGQLAGTAEEQSRLIGAALINNVGTSLENIRALVQATGQGFDTLSESIVQAFYEGQLTIEELYNGLVELQEIFSVGFPDAIGDVERGIRNFQAALADGRGSRQLINSIRDIAQEAQEAGRTFPDLANSLGQALGLSAQQTVLLLEFLKREGIDTVEELRDASLAQLASFLEAARRIRDQGVADLGQLPATPQDPTANRPEPGIFTPARINTPSRSSSAPSRAANNAVQEAKRRREELYKLLTTSTQYANILDSLNEKTITQAQASRQIAELYSQIDQATRGLAQAEKAYREALDKRGKKQEEIAKLAQRVSEAQKKVDELTDRAKKAGETPKFDVSGALKLVQTVNELAVVSRAAGVNVEGLTKTLNEGFLRGKLSITEYRSELKKLEETFSDGIPGAVGDVQGAVKNLFEGGRSGGLFSVDAFKDIFAEFEELFNAGGAGRRQSTFTQLVKEFDEAQAALGAAISGGKTPAEIRALREQLDGAKKALEDFRNTPNRAGLDDLREELSKTLSPDQITAFFEALRLNGRDSFEDIKQAGPDAITKILASLDGLGFNLGETSERVKGLIDNLDKANIAQTNGVDVLGKALDIIKGFNSDTIAGSFDTMADKISNTLGLLSQLGGNTYNNDVVLNVRVNGENGAVGLVESLFGNGSGSGGNTGGGSPGLSPAEQTEFNRLTRLRQKSGRLSASDRRRFEELRRKARG